MTESLQERYRRLRATPSDINEHMARLFIAGKMYPHITEFGVRYGVSTTALLAGQEDSFVFNTWSLTYPSPTLISYDVNYHQSELDPLDAMTIDGHWHFIQGSSLVVDIVPTFCLFIDTYHVGSQLLGELSQHHTKVKSEIILHDVVTFGAIGENGQAPGLQWAIAKFLTDHPEWSMTEWAPNNNGLAVLSRGLESQELKAKEFGGIFLQS